MFARPQRNDTTVCVTPIYCCLCNRIASQFVFRRECWHATCWLMQDVLLIPFIKFKFWFKLKVKFCYEFTVGLGINTMNQKSP